jgi:site-specific recombinase
MAFLQIARRFLRRRRLARRNAFTRSRDELRRLTESFCDSANAHSRIRRASRLFSFLWSEAGDGNFSPRLLHWVGLLEGDAALRESFQKSWLLMLGELDSVPLFADAGLPAHHGLYSEIVRRIFARLLPSARADSDAGLLFTSIFSTHRAVERFSSQPPAVYERFVNLLWPAKGFQSTLRVQQDLRQALRLLATRVAGRGVTAAIRQRGTTQDVHDSPFYRLIFVTETFVNKAEMARGASDHVAQALLWQEAVRRCRQELDHVHKKMEDAGVSSALVYDLQSIEAALERMELLAAVFVGNDHIFNVADTRSAARKLLDTLARGRLEDTRVSLLFRQNLNLLARKTVERTGHSGEHYIAGNRHEYWHMWRAAAGGGLLTVFTAAIKLRLVGAHFPLFVEGFLVGTNYAVTFVLLQIFGLALATKQPSMTAAALAGIVRENRGVSRWSKISDYAAQISRTQLAAAFGNVIAVCIGGVIFEYLWTRAFHAHYLTPERAKYTYHGLNPFESGTAIYAALTGVILWIGGLVGGWCENFVVFNRIPDAIVQHPIGHRVGARNMHRLADWLERNVAAWSNSIVLGYLLGMTPMVAQFFGVPLDVRHVTLNTGMLALAAAQFGLGAFRQAWLYYALAGVAVTFVLNLGVSFSIASIVALRAYNVPRKEHLQIFDFILRQFFRSPREFIFPRRSDVPAHPVEEPTAADLAVARSEVGKGD